jgi:hypothetical protein
MFLLFLHGLPIAATNAKPSIRTSANIDLFPVLKVWFTQLEKQVPALVHVVKLFACQLADELNML